jgi:PIN domain nuclease of toxin-antitoxin system
VKGRVGKLEADIGEISDAIQREGFVLLNTGATHLLALSRLPMHHGNPFDHLLIAQAIAEDATFVSEDRNSSRYPVRSVTCSSA